MYRKLTNFRNQGNAIAFRPDEMRETTNYRNNPTYNIPAVWISANSSTRGALVIGDVRFDFTGDEFKGLSYIQVLNNAQKKVRAEGAPAYAYSPFVRDVSPNAQALIGAGSLWGGGYNNTVELVTELLRAHAELPGLASGYDGWYTLVK